MDASRVAYRPRESPYPMITVREAVDTVLSHAHLMAEETTELTGRYTSIMVHRICNLLIHFTFTPIPMNIR